MAEAEDIQPLVCDNGTGMVKVLIQDLLWCRSFLFQFHYVSFEVLSAFFFLQS
jgi:hypothetical protein